MCQSLAVLACAVRSSDGTVLFGTCPDWSHVNCTTSLLYPKLTSTVALLESLKAAAWLLLLPCLVCVCEQLQSRIHGNASSMLSHMQFGQGPPRHQLISAYVVCQQVILITVSCSWTLSASTSNQDCSLPCIVGSSIWLRLHIYLFNMWLKMSVLYLTSHKQLPKPVCRLLVRFMSPKMLTVLASRGLSERSMS